MKDSVTAAARHEITLLRDEPEQFLLFESREVAQPEAENNRLPDVRFSNLLSMSMKAAITAC